MDKKRTRGTGAGAGAGAVTAKGIDAIPAIIHAPNEQLRVAAETRMASIRQSIATALAGADEAFRAKEQEFLEAVVTWRRQETPQERAFHAVRVGMLQRELTALDEARQSARYPHRFVQKQDLFRTVIDADTRDQRKIPHPVFVERTVTSVPAERIIPVAV